MVLGGVHRNVHRNMRRVNHLKAIFAYNINYIYETTITNVGVIYLYYIRNIQFQQLQSGY